MVTYTSKGMAKNIAEKANLDSSLLVYNRSSQRTVDFRNTLPKGKTEVVESIGDGVSKADIILSCIANDEAVKELYATILKADVKGKLFIEASTIHPETTEAIAKDVLAAGAEFVAAPVFGGPAMAEGGHLIAVLAGPKASVDKAKPFFKGVTAGAEIDLSDQPYGKASQLKVLGNTFILNMVEQLSEAHVVAEKSGLGNDVLHQFVDVLFGGAYADFSSRMVNGDYYKREEPLFSVDLARKDARHAMSLAKEVGARLQNVETGDAHLAAVKEHMGPKGDLASIYGAVRKDAGLKFEKDS